jgi:hypothetical protein
MKIDLTIICVNDSLCWLFLKENLCHKSAKIVGKALRSVATSAILSAILNAGSFRIWLPKK